MVDYLKFNLLKLKRVALSAAPSSIFSIDR